MLSSVGHCLALLLFRVDLVNKHKITQNMRMMTDYG